MLKQAVVLAGGKGTRLGNLTSDTPKPLLKVGDRIFLEFVLLDLKAKGISEVVLLVGYLAEKFEAYLGDGSAFGLSIKYAYEEEPLGTGGSIYSALDMLQNNFLVINGDTIFDVNIWRLYRQFQQGGSYGVIALRNVKDVSRYASIRMQGSSISSYVEKGFSGSGLISGGVYILSKRLIVSLGLPRCSLESDVFPVAIQSDLLCGEIFDSFFIDIGIPCDFDRAQIDVPLWWSKDLALIDMECLVQVHDQGSYGLKSEGLKMLDDLMSKNPRLVVLSHDPKLDEDEFQRIREWLNTQVHAKELNIDLIIQVKQNPTDYDAFMALLEFGPDSSGPQKVRLLNAEKSKTTYWGQSPEFVDSFERLGIESHMVNLLGSI